MGKDHELLEAARNGNLSIVEKILYQKSKRNGPLASLRRGPGANVQDSTGYSALHHASLNGHSDIVRILLAHDASPNIPDGRGSSPLHLAAWAGHQSICKLLLTHTNRPANPNLQTRDAETPLHCAAQHGHTGALTTLLARGANPNMANNRNETPLDLAAQYGRLQAVQMLIRAHPELLLPFKYKCTVTHSPLHLASRNGHKLVVEVLLTAGVNVNLLTSAGTALHEAALCGKDSVVRALLDADADLDATDSEGRTAVMLLEQFPPHVTRGIVSVINNHRNSIAYDSSSDIDDRPINRSVDEDDCPDYCDDDCDITEPEQYYSQYGQSPSPSPSVGSLATTPSPRVRTASGYVQMTPILNSKVSPTPPKKPPRRNLSVSPTHLHQPLLQIARQQMSTSIDSSSDMSSTGHRIRRIQPTAYEYLFLTRSGTASDSDPIKLPDQYIDMEFRPIESYENAPVMRSYNPNRKLRRIRSGDQQLERFSRRVDSMEPRSPTNYQQPPTPEHPPPSARQAEKCILDRIRPLSQEYKIQSGQFTMKSPPKTIITVKSLNASSGSLSSSVSLSDRSQSTDCVEEFIGDIPFAGLFKGSTIALDMATKQLEDSSDGVKTKPERPKTLRPTGTIHSQLFRKNYGPPDDESLRTREENCTLAIRYLQDQPTSDILSPFDENEEWNKISAIMEQFGEDVVPEKPCPKGDFEKWLIENHFEYLTDNLTINGFDDLNFLKNILTEIDFEILNFESDDSNRFLTVVNQLPEPYRWRETDGDVTVDIWLSKNNLECYKDIFRSHLYTDMKRLSTIWEIELQAVLDITKLGHRRRILYSLTGLCTGYPTGETLKTPTESGNIKRDSGAISKVSATNGRAPRKNRPAPQPPTSIITSIEIREPAALLFGVPVGSSASWRHNSNELISSAITYPVSYLGSTMVKELRGTESSRKSIQKLKRIDSATNCIERFGGDVQLSISYRGVRFIAIQTQNAICDHDIKNISSACQDSEDLTHFAYITRNGDDGGHYCHVFKADGMDIATEIILTLGQAFEVAYQLAISGTPIQALDGN